MSKRFHVDPTEKVDIYEFEPGEVISDTPPNVITVRARMDVEIAGRVQGEMAKRNAANQTQGPIGVVAVSLFLHNILAWRGPDFDDLPCTPANICALPPPELDSFMEKVLNRISELNERKTSPNGRRPIGSGFATSGSPVASPASAPAISRPSATSTLRSPLQSALTGRLSKSGD